MKKDLLTILDLSRGEIEALLRRSHELKALHHQGRGPMPLTGKTLAMIFDKPSTRTRVSFEAGMAQLGGTTIYLERGQTQLARAEPLSDTARVLSRYVDGVVARTFAQEMVEELALHAAIPIINGLTDTHHPCQVLGDLMTVEERFGKIDGLKVAWVGDGNNVANSWITAALRLDFELYLACPKGYEPDSGLLGQAQRERLHPWRGSRTLPMLIGWNDWDQALEDAYVQGVLEGRIKPPEPRKPMTIADYGASVTLLMDEITYPEVLKIQQVNP